MSVVALHYMIGQIRIPSVFAWHLFTRTLLGNHLVSSGTRPQISLRARGAFKNSGSTAVTTIFIPGCLKSGSYAGNFLGL
jgi:hypothetical protein